MNLLMSQIIGRNFWTLLLPENMITYLGNNKKKNLIELRYSSFFLEF